MRFFIDISLLYCLVDNVTAFYAVAPSSRPNQFVRIPLEATTDVTATTSDNNAASTAIQGVVLEQWPMGVSAAKEYSEMFGLGASEAAFYGLLEAMRKSGIAYGSKGHPFVLRKNQIAEVTSEDSCFDGFFTMKDLEKALEDDFLDAARGSTDNRKGWKVRFFMVGWDFFFYLFRFIFSFETGELSLRKLTLHILYRFRQYPILAEIPLKKPE